MMEIKEALEGLPLAKGTDPPVKILEFWQKAEVSLGRPLTYDEQAQLAAITMSKYFIELSDEYPQETFNDLFLKIKKIFVKHSLDGSRVQKLFKEA